MKQKTEMIIYNEGCTMFLTLKRRKRKKEPNKKDMTVNYSQNYTLSLG